jgi:hypothetical protein
VLRRSFCGRQKQVLNLNIEGAKIAISTECSLLMGLRFSRELVDVSNILLKWSHVLKKDEPLKLYQMADQGVTSKRGNS